MCLHPRDHLPPEMWEAVFLHLKSPQDLYNVMEAHPFWEALLQLQLPHIQIQLAFPLIADLLAEKTKEKDSRHAGDPYLSERDLLNCRLVCKSWDESVKAYYRDHLNERPVFIDGRKLTENQFSGAGLIATKQLRRLIVFNPDYSPFRDEADFLEPDYYKQWLQSTLLSHPPQSDANPFFSQELTSRVKWDGAIRNDSDFRDTLQAYGRHLQRFNVLSDSYIPSEALYSALSEWLALTPNLKILHVNHLETELREVDIFQEEVTALESFIQDHPLPDLPQLQYLAMCGLPSPVRKALLEKYHQVESLWHHPRVWSWQWESPQSALVPLENWLQRLMLEIQCEEDLLILGRDYQPSWPQLKTMEVDFSHEHRQPRYRLEDNLRTLVEVEPYSPSWKVILTWLNVKFGQAPKLENLFLCLPRYPPSQEGAVLRETQRCRLRLKNVKQLKLRLMNPTILVDFLLPVKDSLQKVAIEFMWKGAQAGNFPPNAKVDLEEKVLWNGYFSKKMLESNLWGIFLKLVFLRVESYEGWTYRRKVGCRPVFINPDGAEEAMNEEEYDVDV